VAAVTADAAEDIPTFSHAVASFDPAADRVLLWTRLSGGARDATLVVARDPELADVVHRSEHTTGPDTDHTITVDVDGLEPATSYWYRFASGGELSPVGRTRTLPSGHVERFRLGMVSCARYSVAPLGVYRALAYREVDLVLHLGDYMYEDEGEKGPRSHEPPHDAVTVDDYRQRLGQIRRDPDAQSLHLRHPVVTIWDDHDFADNAWRTGAKAHDPDEHGEWEPRALAAARARREWLPSRSSSADKPFVTWRSMPIGDLAELVLLDTRMAGRDQHAGDEGTLPLEDPDRSLLGDQQRAWLDGRLRDIDAPWALVASGVVVNEMELSWPRALRAANKALPNGYATIDGHFIHDDQWDGYPAERRRLVRWMGERAAHGRRTVLLSGDVHSSWAFVGPSDASGEPVGVEVTVPAVSSAAMGRANLPGFAALLNRAIRRMDHVTWAEVTKRGYTILDVTHRRVRAEWWHVQPYDDDPVASAELGAALVTARADWPPRFEEAPATVDPDRTPPPTDLPRPEDLGRIQLRRKVRLGSKAAAGFAVVGAAAAGAVTAVRRRADR
jgi:alkaline phosphatase D